MRRLGAHFFVPHIPPCIQQTCIPFLSIHLYNAAIPKTISSAERKKMNIIDQLQQRARQLKHETYALLLAYRHPQTPWYAKVVAGLVLLYAFSPIDIIPDFIPVLGYLDDVILVPAGIAISLTLIPPEVMAECRAQAAEQTNAEKPTNWLAGILIIALWITLALVGIRWLRDLRN